MRRRYIGNERWSYNLSGGSHAEGVVEFLPSGNFKEDEGYARYHIRKKLKLSRLPKGAKVWPAHTGE